MKSGQGSLSRKRTRCGSTGSTVAILSFNILAAAGAGMTRTQRPMRRKVTSFMAGPFTVEARKSAATLAPTANVVKNGLGSGDAALELHDAPGPKDSEGHLITRTEL